MTRGTRRRVRPVVVATLLAGALALGTGPAVAAPTAPVPPRPSSPSTAPPSPEAGAPRYVALGDSWAAGSAAGDLDPASGSCRRSRAAYPVLVARAAGELRWLSRACAAREAGSGNTQFSSLTPETRAVTATVGADAVGLGPLMRACSSVGSVRDCDAEATRAEKAIGSLPRTLDAAVAELRRGAPRAAVTFLGFPLPAEGATCPEGAADAARGSRVDTVVTRLDAVLLDRVRAAGMRFVDVRVGFAGHGVCAAQPWLSAWNAPDARLAGAPNAAGHGGGYRAAAANAVTAALAAPADDPTDDPADGPLPTTTDAPAPTGPAPAEPSAPGEPSGARANPADPERSALFAD